MYKNVLLYPKELTNEIYKYKYIAVQDKVITASRI